jgi:hypothetical protein
MAGANDAGSLTSPEIISERDPARWDMSLSGFVKHLTGIPSWRRESARWLPIKPAAPVINTFDFMAGNKPSKRGCVKRDTFSSCRWFSK